MGHIGDQIRLHALALHLLHQGCSQAAADIVDVLAHVPLFAAETLRVNTVVGVPLGYAAHRRVQQIPLHRLFKHAVKGQAVHHRQDQDEAQEQQPVARYIFPVCEDEHHSPEGCPVCNQEGEIAHAYADRVGSVFQVGLCGIHHFFNQAALPQASGLVAADQ